MELLKSYRYWILMNKLHKEFNATGIWGTGWLPSPVLNFFQAERLAEYYGIIVTRRGHLKPSGRHEEWDAWPPGSEREDGGLQAPFTGTGESNCEAIVRCLIRMYKNNLISEKDRTTLVPK